MARDLLIERDIEQRQIRHDLFKAFNTGYNLRELAFSIPVTTETLRNFFRGHTINNKNQAKIRRWLVLFNEGKVRCKRTVFRRD